MLRKPRKPVLGSGLRRNDDHKSLRRNDERQCEGIESPSRPKKKNHPPTPETSMSKGLDSKKSEKKKPAKTMKEKKLAKQEKKKNAK